MQQGSSISLAVVSSMMGSLEQTVEVRLAPSLKSGLLLGTKAPVMMPHGTDFSFLCLSTSNRGLWCDLRLIGSSGRHCEM